jgi:hypothetical protein
MTMRLGTDVYLKALKELEDATHAYLRARKAERKRMAELQALVRYWAGYGLPETELASITGLTRTTVRRAVGKLPSTPPAQPPHQDGGEDQDDAGAETHGDVDG